MLQKYRVTFSGTQDPDPLHAAFGNHIISDWSDTIYVEANSEEDAIKKAKEECGQQMRNKVGYKTEVKLSSR